MFVPGEHAVGGVDVISDWFAGGNGVIVPILDVGVAGKFPKLLHAPRPTIEASRMTLANDLAMPKSLTQASLPSEQVILKLVLDAKWPSLLFAIPYISIDTTIAAK